ncbi:hypothetical protein EDD29_2969 [Actinocorallia herbida]|uniref:Uncharacterized protein n=1 Tax=Actinocorallia herbida TaxID=58109 RepID=A0A3N1CW06_9ACTN|nr:hypothetical protein [Actinocorallia herbida]ROO85425.1 hypothetical protein EDD29_2969 [Actinocorallia herbida]
MSQHGGLANTTGSPGSSSGADSVLEPVATVRRHLVGSYDEPRGQAVASGA